MSVYLDGNLFPSVDFSDNATTVVSRPVARNLRIPLDKRLLLTTVVPGHPPFSTLVTVKFSKNPSADITLGSEWAGHLRESLILSGQAPGPGFVARQFLFPSIPNLAAGPSVQPSLHPVSANVSPGTSRQDSNYSSGRGGCFAHVDDHNGLPDLNAQYYASGSSPRLSSLAPDSVPDARANSPFGFDASITCLLLTSGQSPNVFSASLPVLKTLMRSHHIPFDGALTVPDALHAILSHLLSGLCVGFCPDSSEESQHRCRCSSFASVYGSRQSMAFESLSLIMSASVDRLPDNQFEIVCVALGLQFTSRVDCLNELGKRRAAIISQHAASNPILALFEKLDTLPKGTLVSVAQSHGLDPRTLNRENLLVNIWNHIGTGKCYRDEGQQSHLACSAASELDTDEDGWDHADPSVRIQIQILRQLGPILRTAPLRRLLELHNVSYVESDKVKVLRKRLKKFLYGLYTGKPSTEHGVGTRRAQYARAEARLREQWPQVIPDHLKRKLLANFRFETSTQALSTFVCGSCAERVPDAQYSTLCLKDFDLDLLSKPRYVPAAAADASHPPRAPSYDDDEELGSQDSDSEHSDGSYDPMDVDENFEPRVWLDGRCPQPPMPRDGLSHSSLLVEPDCLIQDTDTGDTAIVVCKRCRTDLVHDRVPALAIRNRNYLGPVPPELKDLTVVEEAMIALCRAKCWIIQLRDEDYNSDSGVPLTQRGARGHIIIYPQRPSAVARSLPPSLSDVITPVCVIFVGSTAPTAEWLKTKATPLIVRKERVMNALAWLKIHNHLYRDVVVDHDALADQPDEIIPPFHIQHVIPNAGIDSTTSSYIPGSAAPPDPLIFPDLQELLRPPPPSATQFQSVVVADVDGNAPSHELRSAALKHMRKQGSNYVEIPHDKKAVNEFNNPHLFPMMYPTLFPYGLGGLEDDSRFSPLGFKRHVKHLCSLADRRFQEHYSFLFTAFNMIQRRTLLLRTSLKVKRANFDYVAAQFGTVSPLTIHTVSERVAAGDSATANTPEERRVLRLMKEVNLINAHVPGSAQSKLVMRNELRSMMAKLGLPSFYITINPADVYNPLVKFLAGSEIDLDALLPKDIPNYVDQAVSIAKNPFIASQFFNLYMKAFIKTILAYDPKQQDEEGGALGVVRGYYGTVEAQGRGSLHCHMVVWVAGALNPNEIKTKALENGGNAEFQKKLIAFLEDTISTSVPADPRPDLETPLSKFHPCATRGPGPGIAPADQADAEASDLHNLAERCQRHRHNPTCYKYWKGYPDPKECRFDLDASNHEPISVFDPETGEFTLQCLDGLVNNFNQTMLQAIRCNMDIKFIGSGPTAKAVLYYITDYITKSQLQAHVAYAALELAVDKLGEYDAQETDLTMRAKRLLQRCAHSMITKQELSGQQVASYLMDYEDHFTSHKFTNLYWTALESHINKEDPSPECYPKKVSTPNDSEPILDTDTSLAHDADPDDAGELLADVVDGDGFIAAEDNEAESDLITVALDSSGKLLPTANQACDYQSRGDDLEKVSVWDFVAQTVKERIPKKKKAKKSEHETDEAASDPEDLAIDVDSHSDKDWNAENILDFEGRPMPRVPFLPDHLEDKTHHMKVVTSANSLIPVPIGPALPRRDQPETVEKHARLMLILFKPWRHAADLKHANQTWSQAFQQFSLTCSPDVSRYIDNMQLIHECKDSRDAHFSSRRNRRKAGMTLELQRGGRSGGEFGEQTDESLLEHLSSMESSRSNRADRSRADILVALEHAEDCGLIGSTEPPDIIPAVAGVHEAVTEKNPAKESLWRKTYDLRKKQMLTSAKATPVLPINPTPDAPAAGEGGITDGAQFRDSVTQRIETAIRDVDGMFDRDQASATDRPTPLTVEGLVDSLGLNAEQARAFSIVAKHSQSDSKKPLRMYLGGAGGTGKSRVINALQDYFKSHGEERRFRLASYTGVAARNISGMTLHAAMMLGGQYKTAKSGKSMRELTAMWEGVDFLFIDEISMVGCALLSDISHALSLAKGNHLAFGGINVVFAGDFAQLPPVGQTRLYSHLDKKTISKAATKAGQKVVFGKLLWLSVDTVVMLTENMRQTGPENQRFVDLLCRLREGRCTTADYELLNTRLAENLDVDWDSEPWSAAPVIVAENAMKDALNVKMAQDFAIRTGQNLHWYYAQDSHSKNTAVANPEVRAKLMQLDSGKTNSRLGKIPLVIGMPVMISQNFDVAGGVVNGCTGKLVSVRYQVGEDGRRHALSCVIEAPDTTPGIMSELPAHHVVSLRDTTDILFKHPHSGATVTIKRTQLPVLPAFAMTAHKAQGKTLAACVVNFTGCRGTESPYVMVSRATSLNALVILTPFQKDKICCRLSEDARLEFRRLRYLALRTVVAYGADDEATAAKKELKSSFGRVQLHDSVDVSADDAANRVDQLQRRNADISAPNQRLRKVAVDAPILADDDVPAVRRPTKRALDDPTTMVDPPSKRPRTKHPRPRASGSRSTK